VVHHLSQRSVIVGEKVIFPDVPPPQWLLERDCVAFPAVRGEKRFRCLATQELLRERFGARDPSEKEAMRVFEMNRSCLQEIAKTQIIAGRVSADNEVLLTKESFAFKDVQFGPSVRENPYYFRLARQVTAELEAISGTSAGFVDVVWDRVTDTEGHVFYTLDIHDFVAKVALAFTPAQLEQSREIRSSLYGIWGDLLQERNHKQLQELLSARQGEE
jgi:hypothetical protein